MPERMLSQISILQAPLSQKHVTTDVHRMRRAQSRVSGFMPSPVSSNNRESVLPRVGVEESRSDANVSQTTDPTPSIQVARNRPEQKAPPRVDQDTERRRSAQDGNRYRSEIVSRPNVTLVANRTERTVNTARGSSMAVGYRVRGVARVDHDRLNPGSFLNAAPGALRAPSGTLRHI